MFLFDLIRWYEYERCSLQANSIREATAARKPTTAGTLIATGTIRNVGNTSNKRDLNSNREGNHSRDSNYRRGSRDEATSLKTHQQQASQQHKRQLEHLGTPPKAEMLTTVGTQQQEL